MAAQPPHQVDVRLREMQIEASLRTTREASLMSVLNEACKIAVAINGGAAVAMGALLQALIDKAGFVPVRAALLWGIAIAAVGVVLATATFVLRYVSLLHAEDWKIFGNAWGAAAFWIGIGSLAAFVGSVAIPLIAAFTN